MSKFVLGKEVLLNPKKPRGGTFGYTKWIVDNAHAQHPELSTTDLLWAAKRVGVEDQALLVGTARSRVRRDPPVLGPLCKVCKVQHIVELGCPHDGRD